MCVCMYLLMHIYISMLYQLRMSRSISTIDLDFKYYKVKRIVKEHIPITHRQRQHCSDGQREGGWLLGGGGKGWGE